MNTKNIFQRGFMQYIGVIVLALIVAGGAYYFSEKAEKNSEEEAMKEHDVMLDDGSSMEKEGAMMESDSIMDDGDAMEKDSKVMEEAMMESESMMMEDEKISFGGPLLAGSKEQAPLLDFNKADYDKAIASDKLVAIYFYANWCPTCKAEFPKMEQAFDELDTDQVVGFRVNYNDNQTDKDEKGLAKEFGVAYQHTKVFVKNGQRVLKSPEGWEKNRYTEEINKFINQ